MSTTKKIKIVTTLFLINLTVSPLTGYAQTSTQTASIQISTAANVITVSAPSSLQMPSGFSFQNENNTVYKDFSPEDTSNRIRLADTRNNGGFILDLTATSFSDGTQEIPFQNMGIVTLSGTNNPLSINSEETNAPPGDDGGTINAPLHCTIYEEIPEDDPDYYQQGATDIESCETSGQGFINLSGTGSVSAPILIIDGQNPTTGGRIGAWYIGLGIKLTIPPGLSTNTYNSTITLTLTST